MWKFEAIMVLMGERFLKKSMYNISVNLGDDYVIANTMTGAVIKVSSDEWDDYVNNNFHDDFWKENGMVISDEIDEIDLLSKIYNEAKCDKASARVTICPTLDCNFACPYCYEKRKKGVMSLEVQEKILSEIERIYNEGITRIFITWYGGEPLLCKNIVCEMSKKIINISKKKNRECQFGIITNGYLIDEDIVDLFEKIEIRTIQITLDGNKEMHDRRRKCVDGSPTFDRIVDNIKLLAERGFYINVRVNIDKSNAKGFEYVSNLFYDIENIKCYPAFVTEEITQTREQMDKCFGQDQYENVLKEYNNDYKKLDIDKLMRPQVSLCMAQHKYSFVYNYDGNVYKCINDVCMPEKALMNLLTDESNEQNHSIYMLRSPFIEDDCLKCSYLPMCYGRCTWEYLTQKRHSCSDIRYLLKDILMDKYLRKENNNNGVN